MQDTTEKIVNKALWINEGPGSNPDRVPVIISETLSFHVNTEWPQKMYTLFIHQYKGAVCIHFLGPLCILVFSL
jgi:hypothetical protein